MTDNKKLLKEFSTIYVSCNRAKQGALAEIGKIDEKYRKLAEKEKEQLNELVKALDSQLEMYGKYLGLMKEEATAPVEESAPVEEKEEEISDTIFPENNEPEPEPEKVVEETAPAMESVSVSDDSFPPVADVTVDWGDVPADECDAKKKEKDAESETDVFGDAPVAEEQTPVLEINDEGWAEYPDDWK